MDKNNTGFQEDADLYSILNVSSNASKKEISTSFKKLSVSFHADKQNSEDLKQSASIVFDNLNNAYQILCCDVSRIIYDEYGVAGLMVYDKNIIKFQTPKDNLGVLSKQISDLQMEQENNDQASSTVDC